LLDVYIFAWFTILQRVGIFIKAELAIVGNTFEALRNIMDWKRNQTNIDGCLYSALITKNMKIVSKQAYHACFYLSSDNTFRQVKVG